MSPHTQLLIAAVAIGGAIVLTVGLLLGNPIGSSTEAGGADPTLARVTVLELEITQQADAPSGERHNR